MIKLVQCVRRRPDLSIAEFRDAWEQYGDRLAVAATELGAAGARLSTTLQTAVNEALTEARGSTEPFDGVAEVLWPSGSEIAAAANVPWMRERIAELRRYQESFIDIGASSFFFVHELDVLEDS